MPFISAGGTSLSVFMGAIGILCNISKMSGSSDVLNYNNEKSWKYIFNKKNKKKIKSKI